MQKVIITILSTLLFVSLVSNAIFYHRLERTRQQLDSVRMELSAATDRQSELAEILKRDGEILSKSSNTIRGIREQITAIRENYEKMENILSGNNISSNR